MLQQAPVLRRTSLDDSTARRQVPRQRDERRGRVQGIGGRADDGIPSSIASSR